MGRNLNFFYLFAFTLFVIYGQNVGTKIETEYDVIVVGAGIMGSSIGYKMALAGKKALILEQEDLCHSQGSSHGGSRIIRYTHSNEMWLPLVHDAYHEWAQLEEIVGKQGKLLIKNGLLTMEKDRAATKNRADILKQNGIEGHVWKGSEVTQNFPHLVNYDDDWWALYEPSGATLKADECLETIQDEFKRINLEKYLGGKIYENEEFAGFDHFDDHVVAKTKLKRDGTDAQYRAKKIVIAAGGWLQTLLHNLDIEAQPYLLGSYFWKIDNPNAQKYFIPLNHGKKIEEEHKEDKAPIAGHIEMGKRKHPSGQSSSSPKHGAVHKKQKTETQLPSLPSPTLLITNPVGGEHGKKNELEELYAIPGFDYENEIKFCIHKGKKIEGKIEKNEKRKTEDWMWKIPQKHLQKHLPTVNSQEPVHSTTCIYTMTPDEMFIVDQHPAKHNLFIAGGFSGTGFKYGLTIGKMMVQMLENGMGKPIFIEGFHGKEQFKNMAAFSLKRAATKKIVKL